jgi:Tfp pilus assembly protein PilV
MTPHRLTVSSPASPSQRRRLAGEVGFTLIEVLVSALMLALVAGATATALIVTSHASGDQRLRSEAQQLVNEDQDRLRGYSDEQLSQLNGHPTRQAVVGGTTGTTFTIASASSYEDTAGGSSCTSQGAAYYRIVSTVSWTEPYSSRADTNVSAESLISRPVTGDLLTNVQDQTGAAVSGVTVKASGASPQSALTDASGCILFAGLTPDAYTATASKTGYVDASGNAGPTASATVALTGTAKTTPATLHLGLAGLLTARDFTTYYSSTGYYGEADALSWLGTGASGGMPNGYQTTTASTLQLSGLSTAALYPFDVAATGPASYTNNYGAWAGRCLQQEPPTGYDTFTVGPGSSVSADVMEPMLYVASVTYTTSGSRPTTTTVKPAHIKLTFTSSAGTSCTYSWYPTVVSGATMPSVGWLKYPGQPFASTATSGATASASSTGSSPQAGQLTVCADYYDTSARTYYKTSVATTDANMGAGGNTVPTIAIKQSGTSGQC